MALSYNIGSQAAFFSGGHRPQRVSLLGRGGEFPTGLLSRVHKWLKDTKAAATIKDMRVVPQNQIALSLKKHAHTPYPAQAKAVEIAVKHPTGCIEMPTGTGKSFVIAMLCAKLNLETLIIVPSLEIKKQLILDLTQVLPSLKKITIENIDSTRLKTLTRFDCLIIDEAHHSTAKTYRKLNKTAWKGIYRRFFLTATAFRNDPEQTILFESIAGSLIYKLSYKEAVLEGMIVPVDAYYLEVPQQKTDAITWAEVYSQLVVRNDARNLMISKLLLDLQAADKSTLALVKEVAHGKELSEITGIPFAHGEDEESREFIQEFNNGTIKGLIATTGLMGEGVNSKPAEFVIICGLGKAKSALMQQIGRVVRTYPGKESGKVCIIKDQSHKFTLRHYKEQCKVIKDEYGIDITKLDA